MGLCCVAGCVGWGTNLLLSFPSLPFPISFPFPSSFSFLCTVAPQCYFDIALPTKL